MTKSSRRQESFFLLPQHLVSHVALQVEDALSLLQLVHELRPRLFEGVHQARQLHLFGRKLAHFALQFAEGALLVRTLRAQVLLRRGASFCGSSGLGLTVNSRSLALGFTVETAILRFCCRVLWEPEPTFSKFRIVKSTQKMYHAFVGFRAARS